MDKEAFAQVKRCAAKYRALARAYDEALTQAHSANHGSPEMLEHLRKANSIAPEVREAMERYQEAVADLAALVGRNQ